MSTQQTQKLSEIFAEHTKHATIKGITTDSDFFYINPNDETNQIEFGYVFNTGFSPVHEFDYDFDMSWEYNFEEMLEWMYVEYGYVEYGIPED